MSGFWHARSCLQTRMMSSLTMQQQKIKVYQVSKLIGNVSSLRMILTPFIVNFATFCRHVTQIQRHLCNFTVILMSFLMPSLVP